jgi:hypothetical protein
MEYKKTDYVILQTDLVAPQKVETPKNYLAWGEHLRTITQSVDAEFSEQNRRGVAEELLRIVVTSLAMLDDLGYHRQADYKKISR